MANWGNLGRSMLANRSASVVFAFFFLVSVSPVGAQIPTPSAAIQTASGRSPRPVMQPRAETGPASEGEGRPLVTFEDGQLSIAATNASLSEVLFAVRSATGADIDVPPNAASERVTAHLGPGPARKVLSDLLSWSEFDYIIEGSDEDVLAVHSITLMIRTKTGAPASGSTTPSPVRAASQPPPRPPEPEPAPAPEVAVVESHSDQTASTPAPAADLPTAPSNLQPRAAVANNDSVGSPSAASGGSKSPSEMIQELQQMYEQRRQMQQQQNQTGGRRTSP